MLRNPRDLRAARRPGRRRPGRPPPRSPVHSSARPGERSSEAIVLLPPPLGPTSATVSPGASSRSTPSSTRTLACGIGERDPLEPDGHLPRARCRGGACGAGASGSVDEVEEPLGDGEPVRAGVELCGQVSQRQVELRARGRAPSARPRSRGRRRRGARRRSPRRARCQAWPRARAPPPRGTRPAAFPSSRAGSVAHLRDPARSAPRPG